MHWSDGNIWKAPMSVLEIEEEFNYKYIVQTHDKQRVEKWESGDNRKFDLKEIVKYINKPYRIREIKNIAKYEFKIGELKLVYDKENEYLVILDDWRK